MCYGLEEIDKEHHFLEPDDLPPKDWAPKSKKVRVNVGFDPNESKISVDPQLKNYRKTTLIQRLPINDVAQTWGCIEDRVHPYEWINFRPEDRIHRKLVILQQPRYTGTRQDAYRDRVAFRAQQVDLLEAYDQGRIGTMSKKMRHLIETNATKLEFEDDEVEYVLSKGKEKPEVADRLASAITIVPWLSEWFPGVEP